MKLVEYETERYCTHAMTIFAYDNAQLEGRVFVWAGDEDSTELDEGLFESKRYQTFKPFLSNGASAENLS